MGGGPGLRFNLVSLRCLFSDVVITRYIPLCFR